ncbi:MAG: hypothetical protein EAZ39_13680 [Oscillatoriales cyanobacterium]|uniref:hypothetical protein n=1 Tax=Microcoleus sp. PH2017_05_CCC_O_A TaxID=2798816 RepID=UPI001DF05344|nr:hypothetical protein [Microcoleus sp. PH2017_05_CCC_O_A]MCC3433974.1 hypothetical protein [Microcoleus sp. PH2017_05_CCC_O_A]TAG17335.1 MAG: hypothetical protein EAZ39_13680 [Oscillatoriales cyanobacterium]TAG45498.1 MAG: hypothetical protein EAZ33_07500 [Oscillatoriales cyanobacterium]TAG60483.1 MAG: hypothetical protein EAZ28_07100 [Oscillatoriales cyanobacterium]
MNANNSLITPHNTFPESASQESPQVKEVVAVIFPFLIPAPAEEHPFRLNDIVKTGNQYGTVTSLNQTEKPVTITWDASSGEDSFSWTYNLDEIRALTISLVPQFIPKNTAGELPACTTIVLANSEQIQFSNATRFKVESLSEHHILISTLDQSYLFPINLFPGYPTSCTIDIPAPQQLKDARCLSVNELRIRAKTHLALEVPDNFLEFAMPLQKQQLKEKLVRQLSEENYELLDFDIAWEEAWKQQLENLGKKQGFYGFREGDGILQHREGVQRMGRVQHLNLEEPRPFHIQWNSGELLSYSLRELKGLGIARIESIVKLSPNVAYQISEDGSYFTAWIGFRTKALAKAWLIPVKKLVGHLSNLIDCQISELQHTGSKYEYAVECPRHKTLNKRLEALAKVAELDLERAP